MPEGIWYWPMPVPFSVGWRVGKLVFSGGHVALDRHMNIVGVGDIEVQTRAVLENLTRTLHEAGANWRHVVKLNTYYQCNGPDDELLAFWDKIAQVHREFVPDPGPVSTAVRAGLAMAGLLIEIDAIAVIDD